MVRPATGGMRRHVLTLLQELDRSRFSAALFAPNGFGDSHPADVSHFPLDIPTRTAPLADLRTARFLARQLRDNFDLVHGHGLRGAWIALLAAHRAGLPVVFTAHNLVPPLGFLSRQCLIALGRHAVRVLAVSRAVADSLVAAGIRREQIVVVPNGIVLEPFERQLDSAAVRAQYGIDTADPLVVAVGRFAPEKGFEVLLNAFSLLRTRLPAARLALVGSGPLDKDLRAQATHEAGSASNASIHFTGFLDDPAPLLRCADVVAIPSRQEGQGIVALEAMAARRPVVASRIGGLTETIMDGETGLLVPPEDPSALAAALETLLIDPEQRHALGQSARHRVEQLFTAERMVRQIEAIYTGSG